jgi:colanic acid/amylovoran biosynthesis glycosyltransferase
MRDNNRHVICVISPSKNIYSETFIRAHIERLPATVKVLYGGWFPTYREDDEPLVSPDLASRIVRAAGQGLFRLPPQYFQIRALRDFLKVNKIEAVLAEYGPTGVEVMNSSLEAGVPFVVHFHGFDAYAQHILGKYGMFYRHMFTEARAVIAVSYEMEQQLLALGAPREKLFYNPYGVDTSLFSEAHPASAAPFFVAAGRFVDKKAPHLTLMAFRSVVESCSKARLMMIGDGPLLEACKQLARALGIAGQVQFPGPRSHWDVATTMRRARAFVQHSLRTTYGDAEGTPVAVLEAGASGLPVVATRHAGITDIVLDGKTGFLGNEGDIERMANCMIQLANNPALAEQLGQAARARVCAEFSMEKSIHGLWRIITEALQGR